MTISDSGIDLIKDFEGLRLKPYCDIRGRWTIGWGHTQGITAGSAPIDQAQAESYLWDDIEWAEKCVTDNVAITMTQCEFDALVSFTFNEGCGKFKGSTLLQKLNKGDRRGAAKEFDRWVYYKDQETGEELVSEDLQKRRELEKTLFLQDYDAIASLSQDG